MEQMSHSNYNQIIADNTISNEYSTINGINQDISIQAILEYNSKTQEWTFMNIKLDSRHPEEWGKIILAEAAKVVLKNDD